MSHCVGIVVDWGQSDSVLPAWRSAGEGFFPCCCVAVVVVGLVRVAAGVVCMPPTVRK